MKCEVCGIKEARKSVVTCSDECSEVRLTIIRLTRKYTPTNGCKNCWGDLGGTCTDTCKEEFKRAKEFTQSLNTLIQLIIK